MKKTVSSYLQAAQRNAHDNYAHADGQFSDAGAFGRDAFSGYRNASGSGSTMPAPTSQPYVINVTNASATAVNNFAILGANEYIYGGTGTWDANGSLVQGGITISSGMPNVSYREMLSQFATNPFKVGLTYYQSASASQILQSLSVVHKDANGNSATRPIVPTIDPYQNQSTVLAMNDVFTVDGNTKIIISSVLASATINFKFYPSDNINLARGLEQSQVSKAFTDPGIVKAQKVEIK